MGFELTGATPDERLKELTEKLEQETSKWQRGVHQRTLRRISVCHVQISHIQFRQRHAHSHAKPGCILCGRVSHMEERVWAQCKGT